jgi:hypothetical protein
LVDRDEADVEGVEERVVRAPAACSRSPVTTLVLRPEPLNVQAAPVAQPLLRQLLTASPKAQPARPPTLDDLVVRRFSLDGAREAQGRHRSPSLRSDGVRGPWSDVATEVSQFVTDSAETCSGSSESCSVHTPRTPQFGKSVDFSGSMSDHETELLWMVLRQLDEGTDLPALAEVPVQDELQVVDGLDGLLCRDLAAQAGREECADDIVTWVCGALGGRIERAYAARPMLMKFAAVFVVLALLHRLRGVGVRPWLVQSRRRRFYDAWATAVMETTVCAPPVTNVPLPILGF